MFGRILAGVLALVACGCAYTDARNQNSSLNEPTANWKPGAPTAVVLGSTERIGSFLGNKPRFTFRRVAPGGNLVTAQKDKNRPGETPWFLFDRKRLKATSPGHYQLAVMQFPSPDLVYRFEGTLQQPFGSFSVEPGEIVYIGHILVESDQGPTVKFRVEDRLEEYIAGLPPELQPYADQIEKRLIKLPEQVTLPHRRVRTR